MSSPMTPGKCRICECDYFHPCEDIMTGDSCYWVQPDLCSACAYGNVDEEALEERRMLLEMEGSK